MDHYAGFTSKSDHGLQAGICGRSELQQGRWKGVWGGWQGRGDEGYMMPLILTSRYVPAPSLSANYWQLCILWPNDVCLKVVLVTHTHIKSNHLQEEKMARESFTATFFLVPSQNLVQKPCAPLKSGKGCKNPNPEAIFRAIIPLTSPTWKPFDAAIMIMDMGCGSTRILKLILDNQFFALETLQQ
jgi:hypothetical protein